MTDIGQIAADHHMRVDRISTTPKTVLIVVANPSTSSEPASMRAPLLVNLA